MNFREVNKKLNELKSTLKLAKETYQDLENCYPVCVKAFTLKLEAKVELDKFRNTKISEIELIM